MTTIRRTVTIALLTVAALSGCSSNPVAAHATSRAPSPVASTPVATPTTPPPTQVAADATPVKPFPPSPKPLCMTDDVIYLHSSGSTGFPKPITLNQYQTVEWCRSREWTFLG